MEPSELKTLVCAIALFVWSLPSPEAIARDTADVAGNAGPEINFETIICFDPKTEKQFVTPIETGRAQACPAQQIKFISLDVERSPGAEPLSDQSGDHHEKAEVEDAPKNRP